MPLSDVVAELKGGAGSEELEGEAKKSKTGVTKALRQFSRSRSKPGDEKLGCPSVPSAAVAAMIEAGSTESPGVLTAA